MQQIVGPLDRDRHHRALLCQPTERFDQPNRIGWAAVTISVGTRHPRLGSNHTNRCERDEDTTVTATVEREVIDTNGADGAAVVAATADHQYDRGLALRNVVQRAGERREVTLLGVPLVPHGPTENGQLFVCTVAEFDQRVR